MTGNINLLQSVCDMNLIAIGMPNRAVALASKDGFVKFNGKLILSHVLYVHSLNCNLISIAQLIDDLCCDVTFTPELCVIHDLTSNVTFTPKLCLIQDLTMKMLIGSGEYRTGVHFYKESPTRQLQANKADSHDLWH